MKYNPYRINAFDLYKIMRFKKIKIKDVAEACGVSESTVREWKNGTENPNIENLKKLENFLGCKIEKN